MTLFPSPAILSDLHAEAIAAPGTPLRLAGMFNLRDLGGYFTADGRRTRTGRVFRADSLAHVTEEDGEQLERLGLRLICDLRYETEVAQYPDRVPAGARYEHNPMLLNVNVMGDFRRPDFDWAGFRLEMLFTHMLDNSGPTFRRVFEYLADAGSYPYLFHCAGGKDRTGMTAALLLRCAGVPDATIVADFALSDRHIAPKVPEFQARMRERGVDATNAEKMFRAPAGAMEAALAHLDTRWGGVEGYLGAVGVQPAAIEAFVAQFVAEAGPTAPNSGEA
jgi:protein-tyrosine phosphatase